MADKMLNIGLVGASSIAPVYLRALGILPDVRVAAICSQNQERAQRLAQAYGVPLATNNLAQLLDDVTISAIIIVTEPERHIDLARLAMQADKHVLIEKPLDSSLAKAESYYSECLNYPHVVSVVSPKRFDPALHAMKARFDATRLAGPVSASLSLMWPRDQDYYMAGSGWRAQNAPVMVNQGLHWLDVLAWFFGPYERCRASSRTTRDFLQSPDQTTASIDFPGQVSVALCAGTFAKYSRSESFTIFVPEQRLDYTEIQASQRQRSTFATIFSRVSSPRKPTDLMRLQIQDFIQSIRCGTAPATSVENGVQALRLALELSQID